MGLQVSAADIAPDLFQNIVETDRNLIRASFTHPGICHPGDFVLTNGSGLTGSITPGRCVLVNRETSKQGYYMAWGDTADTVTWPAPTSLTRWDTLVLRVADPQYGTLAVPPGAYWDVIQGVPGSGVPRTDSEISTTYRIPGTWERVYDVQITPGATSLGLKVDKRRLASAPGMALENGNYSALAGSYVNEIRNNLISGRLERWNGAVWRGEDNMGLAGVTPNALIGAVPGFTSSPLLVQAGTVQATFGGSGIPDGQTTISWPTPFPGGVLTLVVTDGSASAGALTHYSTQAVSLTTFGVVARALSTGTPVNGLRQINFIGLGF